MSVVLSVVLCGCFPDKESCSATDAQAFPPDFRLSIPPWPLGIQDMACEGQSILFTANNRIFRLGFQNLDEPIPIANLYEGNVHGDSCHYFGITCSPDGIIYLADTYNHVILSLDSDGSISTIAGCAGEPGFADAAIGSEARFAVPIGVCYREDDTLIVADSANNAIRIVSTVTGATQTLIGNERESIWCRIRDNIEEDLPPLPHDGPVESASLRHPCHVGIDSKGRIIVASNGTGIDGALGNTVCSIDVDEEVLRTISGQPDVANVNEPVCGPANVSRLTEMHGLAIDGNDNVYVGNDQYLMQITSEGFTSIVYTNTVPMQQFDYEKESLEYGAPINTICALCWEKDSNTLLIFGTYTIARLAFDKEGRCTGVVPLLTE